LTGSFVHNDLTTRRLAPVLYDLYLHGALSESCLILGVDRSEMNDDRFREKIRKAIAEKDMSKWEKFFGGTIQIKKCTVSVIFVNSTPTYKS
jgi:glucose-6-phosphate 1-dehydrogenase